MTQLIARRVLALRKEQRLSGAALSKRVRELGAKGWTDSTVSKLETGRRESVSVQELFRLALALNVPPTTLCVDTENVADSVPVADELTPDSFKALMWMLGKDPLTDTAGGWASSNLLITAWEQVAHRLRWIEQVRDFPWNSTAQAEEAERDAIRALNSDLEIFTERPNLPTPPLPPRVVRRAAELGVELQGTS